MAVWLKNANQQEVPSWKLKNRFQQQYEFLHINAFHSLSLYHSEAKTLYQQVWVPYFSLGKNNVINYVQIHCIISHYSCSINTWNIQSITVTSLWQQAVENCFLTAFVLGICYINTSFNNQKNTSFHGSNFKHIVLRIHHSLHYPVLFFFTVLFLLFAFTYDTNSHKPIFGSLISLQFFHCLLPFSNVHILGVACNAINHQQFFVYWVCVLWDWWFPVSELSGEVPPWGLGWPQ